MGETPTASAVTTTSRSRWPCPYYALRQRSTLPRPARRVQCSPHLHRTLQRIKDLDKRAGVSFNPATPIDLLDNLLDDVDLVLIMTVNPGFGGQSFIRSQLAKIRAARERIDGSGRRIDLEVDGGINPETAPQAIEAGADVLVAGTASFSGGPDAYAGNIRRLRGDT